MRLPLYLTVLLTLAMSSGHAASAAVPAKPARPPVHAGAAAPSELDAQLARVNLAAKARLRPAYPEALIALSLLQQKAGKLDLAQASAQAAVAAYDRQLELHKDLSDVMTVFEQSRAERAAARELGMARDEAIFRVAQLAELRHDEDLAIQQYVLLVQSQPEQRLGLDALAALKDLGWLHSPLPAVSTKPVGSPAP